MIFKLLLYYIIGYLNIEVQGLFVERFINICKSRKILLWNIKMKKGVILYANISIKDYKEIREIAKETKTKVKIKKKCGFPFFINKYRKRKILGICLAVMLLGIVILSNFVWNINITGNENIESDEILKELKKTGLGVGTLKNKIDTNIISNKIRLNRNDIAWIGISIKGTNAQVKIKETIKAPKIIDENEYCNIISNKNCRINKISVQNGTQAVKEGDIVKEGDVLVNGYLEGKYTGIRYVHAMANIEGKVWYAKKEKVYLSQEKLTATGKTETKYSLKFNNFKINFYKTLSKFKNYDTISTSKKLRLFSNFYLPIELIKITNKEKEKTEITYTESELTEKTIKKFEKELKKEIHDIQNIVNEQINTKSKDGYIEVEVIYEVLEAIGKEDKIVF